VLCLSGLRRPAPNLIALRYPQPSPSVFAANTVTLTTGFPSSSPGPPPPSILHQWPLSCWDYGFESRRIHGCLSVARCQAEFSALDWSLIQRCPTECGVYKWAWSQSLDNLEPLVHEEADVPWKNNHNIISPYLFISLNTTLKLCSLPAGCANLYPVINANTSK